MHTYVSLREVSLDLKAGWDAGLVPRSESFFHILPRHYPPTCPP